MSDDTLNLIEHVARLRRQIATELDELKADINSARTERTGQFKTALHMRFNPLRMNLASENLRKQAQVMQDIASWFQEKAERGRSYKIDMAAAQAADPTEQRSILVKLRTGSNLELTVEIPRLRDLASSLEALSSSYHELLGKRRAARSD
jgi:hypothetical protein